ncbi:CCR4-NOT transcription complex subunit 1-like isoform X2 [Apostichopus japonicus]|uniref:CCR4-NOT transcription complex subunit 1-like isoform X2 n=1 Tax=Stichopus japonicus TaxID=307972 RepID=UPI003AB16E5B
MNLDSLSLALSQISILVANLTKKNYKQSVGEVARLVSQHGPEADRHLLRCLFSAVDFSSESKTNGKDAHQTQYLVDECSQLVAKPSFISSLCFAVDNPLSHQKTLKPSPQLLHQISKVLKLTKVKEVVFGLALTHSASTDLKNFALQYVKQRLPDFLRLYIDADQHSRPEASLADLSVEILHLLLTHLLYRSKDQLGIPATQTAAFLKALKKEFPVEQVPVVLVPLLYSDRQDITMDRITNDPSNIPKGVMDASLADMLQEMGYACCASPDDCKKTLKMVNPNLNPGVVAKVIGMMARTHDTLTDSHPLQTPGGTIWGDGRETRSDGSANSWNIDAFVDVIKEVAPHMNFHVVAMELDHPALIIKDGKALQMVKNAIVRATQTEFPVEILFKVWNNKDGQLSWIQQALKFPEVFCFSDFQSSRKVVTDILKSPPEDENKKIATWKSLELVEVLLKLAETEKADQVQLLFTFPIKNCPDLLLLALLQVQSSWSFMKSELIRALMPTFLGNHANSGIILHYAWSGQGRSPTIQKIIIKSMAEWYLNAENDQTRLSRILDIAQDLKALLLLLSTQQYNFMIDLACLASRREYLKLEKWMTDKIREIGEPFVKSTLTFLKRKAPQVSGLVPPEPRDLPGGGKTGVLPTETIATILACLQACQNNVSPETSDVIMQMVSNCSPLLNSVRPPQGVIQPQNALPALSPHIGPGLGPGLAPGINSPMDPMPPLQAPIGTSATPTTPGAIQGFPPGGPLSGAFSNPPPAAPQFPLLSTVGLGSMNNPSHGMDNSLRSNMRPGNMMTNPVGTGATGAALNQPPRTPGSVKPADISNLWPELSQTFPPEIDEEANRIFQKIYNQPQDQIKVDDVLMKLKKFKDSTVKKERDVFMCMLRNLFEEYKFYHQYPERELMITACLFGGIIEQGLVTYMALGIALRYILDALRKSPDSKTFMFGITALDKFKTRLKEYPQYCQHLASIPHLSQFPERLIEYIQYGQQSMEPPSRPNISSAPVPAGPTTTVSGPAETGVVSVPKTATTTTTSVSKILPKSNPPSIANTTNIDTLLSAKDKRSELREEPPEAIQEKVAFIFNNLSLSNMTQKGEELSEVITEEHIDWLAQYLVMKRASIEINFHQLYANLVDHLKIQGLVEKVMLETYSNIEVLLSSDKSASNFSDRSLLKNLGHWLGLLTLAKNKPILQIDLDLKSLLFEAFHKGQSELLYVVPFVAKVMEACLNSRVFKPPNPWTMAIINVLAELHQTPSLKLNLKFEVEVLCKNLGLDINELDPPIFLKEIDRLRYIKEKLSVGKPKEESLLLAPVSEPPAAITTTVTTAAVTLAPTTTTTTAGSPSQMPQFNFHDLNTTSLNGLAPHIVINSQLALFQNHPQLRSCVRPAIDRAVSELVHPVVDRSIKIALTTCEQIIKKDFALDPEETRMRQAAHHMVRNLTAGMAMITCREPLIPSISNNFKTSCLSAINGGTQQQKDMIEQASGVIAQENVELACCFIQKCAVEKAIPEMDRRLATEIELRKHARQENRRYCDPVVLTYQAERMPEQIRLRVGGAPTNQIAVYEEFARSIPGFLPTPEANLPSGFLDNPPQAFVLDDMSKIYEKCMSDIEAHLHALIQTAPHSQHLQVLHTLLEAVAMARNSREVVTALALLTKAVEGILEGYTPPATVDTPELAQRYRDCHILVLKALQDQRAYGSQWTNKQITRVIFETTGDRKYNLDAIEQLLRSHLINLQTFDQYLAGSMESGLNFNYVAFAMGVAKRFLVDDQQSNIVNEADLYQTLHMLSRILTQSANPPEGLQQLIEMIRQNQDPAFLDKVPGGPTSMMHSGISQAREYDDPHGLREKTEYLLREWVQKHHSPAGSRDNLRAFSAFVSQMHQQGILKTDDLITRFFRICIELCVDLCYRAQAEQAHNPTITRAKCFHTLDAFVRLIALLVKHSGDVNNPVTKINLLNKVLGIVAGVLLQDHEARQTDFHQLAYHRIFSMLLLELNAPEQILEAINFQIMTAFCNALHVLRPSKAPGFVYSWLELISHRIFIARMLAVLPQQKGWPMYAQVLIDLLKFLAPFLRNAELPKHTFLLYKGTLRVLLVLLHDFPEFLCDYHYGFCDVIPPNCIQMRNLILSAFPRNMRMPDPFTPNLKVDMLPDITQPPRILTNFSAMIQPTSFKKDLDSYIKTRGPVTFLSELRSHLQVSNEAGQRYHVSLMNALVLYVGSQAIAYIHSKGGSPSMSNITHSSHMDIFQNLVADLDTEGRYIFLNAIANQLRYPNSHTHYFSCTLLYLFAEANTEAIQEQITRVLLERLIVNRPHPWGLLITFIELIRNHNYKFWNHEFIHCAPELERLFESVARSCIQPKQPSQQGRTSQEGGEAQELSA